MRTILALALVLPSLAFAQEIVNQGQGQSLGSKAWGVNIAAQVGGKTTEVAVTNSAGGTAVPASALANRRAIEIQNNGPNTIYCTVDGTAPLVGSNGRWIVAGAAWSLDAGPNVTIKCIASTAAQVTGAATMVTELK
jgi:hypothetical protein